MRGISNHCLNNEREAYLKEGNIGIVIHRTIAYCERAKREYKYEITDKAVLIVRAMDDNSIVTRYPARPSRIKKYWENAPKYIIMKAVENCRRGLDF